MPGRVVVAAGVFGQDAESVADTGTLPRLQVLGFAQRTCRSQTARRGCVLALPPLTVAELHECVGEQRDPTGLGRGRGQEGDDPLVQPLGLRVPCQLGGEPASTFRAPTSSPRLVPRRRYTRRPARRTG